MVERTLAIIKPDAVAAGVAGEIISQIQQAGFRIVAMKLLRMTADQAGAFYAVHRERPFYAELVRFMSSGPVIPMVLEKENAVADFRTLIGATDPAEAAEGTIRKRFARSKGENAIHGSDSIENARAEIAFFFAEMELVG